jgi:hypothetical protein
MTLDLNQIQNSSFDPSFAVASLSFLSPSFSSRSYVHPPSDYLSALKIPIKSSILNRSPEPT